MLGVLGVSLGGPATAAPAAPAPSPTIDRTVTDDRIDEASGLAASPSHPGVLWTHEDSGAGPVLYALAEDGSTAATVRLGGVDPVDWEAMVAFSGSDGTATLAVGDIGDNGAARSSVRVLILPEPALRTATVRPTRVLSLRYPDGPRDAETLLEDPTTHRLYVVSKGFGGALYAVPEQLWPGPSSGSPANSGTLERVAGIPLLLVTDGAFTPEGQLVLRTYSEVAVFARLDGATTGGSLRPIAVAALPVQEQGESLTLVDAGRTVLVGSEGRRGPILRVPLPEVPAARTSPDKSSAASNPAAPTSAARQPVVGTATGPLAVPLAGGAAVVAVLALMVVAGARRSRAGRRG